MCGNTLIRTGAFLVALSMIPATFAATSARKLQVHLSYVQDGMYVVRGGHQRGIGTPGLLHLDFDASATAWGGSPHGHLHVDLMATTGSSISRRAGDLQGLDNAEARNTVRLFEAWYQRDMPAANLQLRLGLQDYNALFNSLDAAGVFLNSSFGIEPTISQSNVSIFPVTALGAVLRWQDQAGAFLMGGVYDGTPGLPGHPDGTHIHLRRGDGLFSGIEGGIEREGSRPWKLAVGAWGQTSATTDPTGRVQRQDGGLYLIGQMRLLASAPGQPPVDAFVQLGSAAPHNLFRRYFGAGVRATGVFLPSRGDVLGLAVARAHTSTAFRRSSPGSKRAETVFELTWSVPINTVLTLQPDMQYIIDPGAIRRQSNALIAGLRMRLQL
jgi:porin